MVGVTKGEEALFALPSSLARLGLDKVFNISLAVHTSEHTSLPFRGGYTNNFFFWGGGGGGSDMSPPAQSAGVPHLAKQTIYPYGSLKRYP